MILQILFIAVCFMADEIIGNFLPHSFICGDIVITSCLGLSAMVLSQRKMERIDSLLVSILFGLYYDCFVAHSFLVCTITFVLVNLLVSKWQKHITESVFESCLLVFTTIFVKEFLIYFIMTLLSETLMPFSVWLISRAFLTLIVNGMMVVMIVMISRYVEHLMFLREMRIRNEEKISWWKISSKP